MNVCPRNVTCFAHVECMFDKSNDIFQGFGSLVSLRLQKDRRAKSQQIWTNPSHWNTDGLSSHFEDLLFFKSLWDLSPCETAVIYYYITTTEFFITWNVTQRMEMLWMGKNVNRHFRQNFDTSDILLINITDLNANIHLYTSMLKGVSHVSRNETWSCNSWWQR